jgi:hypothetical protein
MSRIPRRQQWTDEACYRIMNGGHNRERTPGDDVDRRQFLLLLARHQKRFGLRLYHNCLMTNHYHLLVQRQRPAEFSSWLADMLHAYVHYFDRPYGFMGHLRQDERNPERQAWWSIPGSMHGRVAVPTPARTPTLYWR